MLTNSAALYRFCQPKARVPRAMTGPRRQGWRIPPKARVLWRSFSYVCKEMAPRVANFLPFYHVSAQVGLCVLTTDIVI